ncbi:uncharacterized protein LOC101861405 [Aplysia californica]|uniref:Uncharacterized protein LOC101861405 n=1 Tax=Aplysia californica TaxID=6500 RepID=A0ABM0JAT8_APLCA|nr:uncharacterized protein LOC101861405 [Aplysia californica]
MNGKLGLSGAYNRKRTLSPLQNSSPSQENQKESYSRVLNENKVLKEKNVKLKEDLQDLRSSLKQVTSESSHENIDERRINLIKFQVIQLERQIAILNEALGSRSEAIMETENTMAWLADRLRSYVASEIKGPMVSISRSDLTSMIEALESSRIKLFKSVEKCDREEVGKSLLLLNPFLNGKAKQKETLSVLDISLGRMDYLNLQHVAQLESKLCTVYKELIGVHEQMQSLHIGHVHGGSMNCAEQERLMEKLLKSLLVVKDATDDLLALSLLCPSSPWPVLSRPLTKEVPVERVIAALPQLPRSKKDEVVHILQSGIGTCNHRYHLLEKEKAALKEELAFHRSVYEQQVKYTTDLFDALRKGYSEFEESAKSVICAPLENMLGAYKKLKKSTSEAALRDFLLIIKENELQLSSVIDMFDKTTSDSNGADAFGAYGADLMSKLAAVEFQCQQRRDKAIREKKSVREEQKRRDRELQNLIEDLEAKYEKQWLPYSNGMSSSRAGSKESLVEVTEETIVENPSRDSNEDLSQMSAACRGHTSKPDRIVVEDPTILRSYLDEDSDWVSAFDESAPKDHQKGTKEEKSTKREALNSGGFISSNEAGQALERNEHPELRSSRKSGAQKPSSKWVPDKEWINDFTSQLKSASPDSGSKRLNSNEDDLTQVLAPTEGKSARSQPLSSGRKTSSRIFTVSKNKPKSYEQNLGVAQSSLKLKKQSSFSSSSNGNSKHDGS